MSTETSDPITTVTGEIHHLDPESTVLRRFTAPGASVNRLGASRSGRPGLLARGRHEHLARVQRPAPGLAAGHGRLPHGRRRRGLNNTLYFVDELPEDPIHAPVDGLTARTSGSEFTYRPDHDWWYFSDMNRDEVLFFVFYDSDHSHAWRCIHTAFQDPSVQPDVPRFSIEFRTFAYFE